MKNIVKETKNATRPIDWKRRSEIYKELNDLLFSGNLGKDISKVEADRISK